MNSWRLEFLLPTALVYVEYFDFGPCYNPTRSQISKLGKTCVRIMRFDDVLGLSISSEWRKPTSIQVLYFSSRLISEILMILHYIHDIPSDIV